jgi:rhodanese-related sulfurtransferase
MEKTVRNINPIDVYNMLEGGEEITIIDVREPSEFTGDMGHIEGSLNIPISEISKAFSESRLPLDKPLAFICATGERSLYASKLAADIGHKAPMNIRGGMVQWHLTGLEVSYE